MAANTSVNLSSQRISFVNKISLVMKATSDDENPTPGYMYKEINDISYESVGYSESLVEFLVDRLSNKSCHVKFKVLKVMKHVTENGSKEFQLGLRKHSDVIKECTKFGGAPHPMHGNVPYVMVRNIAKELCELLYNIGHASARSPSDPVEPEKQEKSMFGGLGPFSSREGPYHGFGNTPQTQSKGIGETILGGIEKLGAKMTESASDRQAAILAKLDLSSSTINYRPPEVVTPSDQAESVLAATPQESNKEVATAALRKTAKKPTPGKAGGGWGDEDDEDDVDEEKSGHSASIASKQQSIDTDSLADSASRLHQEEPQADWALETEAVLEVLRRGSTGIERAFLSPSSISAFLKKCATLSCDRIVEIIAQKVHSCDPGVVIRCLQVLEGIVFSREELIPIDLLTSTCKGPLVNCYLSCQSKQQVMSPDDQNANSHAPSAGGQTEQETNADNEANARKKNLWGAAQAKSAKLILILQQLSSHKEIMPTGKFKDYLPANWTPNVPAGSTESSVS